MVSFLSMSVFLISFVNIKLFLMFLLETFIVRVSFSAFFHLNLLHFPWKKQTLTERLRERGSEKKEVKTNIRTFSNNSPKLSRICKSSIWKVSLAFSNVSFFVALSLSLPLSIPRFDFVCLFEFRLEKISIFRTNKQSSKLLP